MTWRYVSQIGILQLVKYQSSWWSISDLVSRIVFWGFWTISLFLEKVIPRSFLFSVLSIIMFDVTYIFLSQYVSSLSFLSLWFDRKVFQLLFTDGIVPQLNSIRTDPWFVFLSIFGVVVVLLYPSYSQMTSWFLIRFDSIQSDTSPNTRHHRSQLTRKLSRAEVLEHMSSSNRFHRNENFQSEKDCITSSFSIFPDVKLCSVNSKSSVKREFDCRY